MSYFVFIKIYYFCSLNSAEVIFKTVNDEKNIPAIKEKESQQTWL